MYYWRLKLKISNFSINGALCAVLVKGKGLELQIFTGKIVVTRWMSLVLWISTLINVFLAPSCPRYPNDGLDERKNAKISYQLRWGHSNSHQNCLQWSLKFKFNSNTPISFGSSPNYCKKVENNKRTIILHINCSHVALLIYFTFNATFVLKQNNNIFIWWKSILYSYKVLNIFNVTVSVKW